MSQDRIEVSRSMPVSASTVYELLTTPGGHVQVDSSGMLMSAEGSRAQKVGDSFTVHMDREALNDYPLGEYDVEVEFTELDPERHVQWKIISALKPPFGHRYGYRIEADPEHQDRILVTSYCDWTDMHPEWRGKVPMPVVPESALRATLGILDRTARRHEAA